jgi:hypothetical protein
MIVLMVFSCFEKKLRLWIAPRGPHRRLDKVAYPCSGPRLHKSWSKALSAGSARGDAGSEAGNRDGCPRNGNLNALAFTGGDFDMGHVTQILFGWLWRRDRGRF